MKSVLTRKITFNSKFKYSKFKFNYFQMVKVFENLNSDLHLLVASMVCQQNSIQNSYKFVGNNVLRKVYQISIWQYLAMENH